MKFISDVTTVLLFMLLCFTVFTVVSSKIVGSEPNIFGYQLKTVLSGSMEPEIQTGSIIAIKPSDDGTQYKRGDVITFTTKDDILITHRIVEVKGDGSQYITKGDNNDAPDLDPVLASQVVGEYTGFIIPYVGYLTIVTSSRLGAALLLVLPGLLLLGYAVVTIWRGLQRVEVPTESQHK